MALLALLKTFWIPIALWLLRNGYSLYQQLRATYASNQSRIRPCPSNVQRALNLIFFSALTVLLLTFQTPPNVFRETQSKLQTSPEVIFSRLRSTRPLTPLDEILKEKLKSKESKLLYLAYGPYALADCTFCKSEEPLSYLLYSLPSLVAPHLVHSAILALSTSGLLAGKYGARWRPHITLAVLALAAGELYLTFTYNVTENVKSTRWTEIDFFYDKVQLYRSLAFVAVDIALASVTWLSSTNRLFVCPASVSERLQGLLQSTETSAGRQWAAGAVVNAMSRDQKLRDRWQEYWRMDGEVSTDRHVLEAEKNTLARMDTNRASQLIAIADNQARSLVDRVLPECLRSDNP